MLIPMHEAGAASRPPIIRCTPPGDPSFVASVSRSYAEATEFLAGDAALLVGTLVRLRVQYPTASIIPISLARRDAPFVVWLVSREGWTEIEPEPSHREGVAESVATARRAARQGA
jgi:hypothetical protein